MEEVFCKLNAEEQICPVCNTTLEVIGNEIIRNELEYIPAKVKVKQYVRLTYGCPKCKQSEEPYIIKAPTKKPLMKHSLASPSSVAWTMYQKYANGMPLYRQEKDWKQYGVELSRTTLANWIIYCSSNYFTPMYDYFHRKLLERQFLMADETRVQVLNEPERKAQTDSFMWLYRTGEDGCCSFSNNLSENAIRPFTIGRKNWLFSNSVAGAKASATVYSIVEMAKANKLNIYRYMEYLLEARPSAKMSDKELELLAPWNQTVIDSCSN